MYTPMYHLLPQVLAAAGAVDHDELVKLAEAKFGSLPTGSINTSQLVKSVCVLVALCCICTDCCGALLCL